MDQRRLWETIADSFSATRPRPWRPVVDWLAGLEPTRVLDLMGGNGRHGAAARRLGHDAVTVDWSRGLLRHGADARVQADATALPFRDGAFGAALFVAGLHGVPGKPARQACLREVRRVLRPAAPVLATVWSRGAQRFAEAGPPGPLDVSVPWRAGGHDAPRFVHLYTPEELRHEAEEAGLCVQRLDEVALGGPERDNLWLEARNGLGGAMKEG